MTYGDSPVGDKQEMIAFLHAAVERGITFFDTAEVYGPFTNEELLGEALEPFRGQIALTWLLAQKPWIVPIPGSRKIERLDENIGAVAVELTPADLREIESAIATMTIQGDRYPVNLQQMTGR